jgi:hypothetical protein
MKGIFYRIGDFSRFDGGTTGKYIQSGVAIFRPCMNGYMRFRYNNSAADTVGIKLMKNAAYDSRARIRGSFYERLFEKSVIIEKILITIEEFNR